MQIDALISQIEELQPKVTKGPWHIVSGKDPACQWIALLQPENVSLLLEEIKRLRETLEIMGDPKLREKLLRAAVTIDADLRNGTLTDINDV